MNFFHKLKKIHKTNLKFKFIFNKLFSQLFSYKSKK